MQLGLMASDCIPPRGTPLARPGGIEQFAAVCTNMCKLPQCPNTPHQHISAGTGFLPKALQELQYEATCAMLDMRSRDHATKRVLGCQDTMTRLDYLRKAVQVAITAS